MSLTDRSGERGATAFMVAAAMLLLMGFASLAVDAGMGLGIRRGAQNAADLAALAAAWQDCNPSGTLTSEWVAIDTAAKNGYDNSNPEVEVVPEEVGDGWKVTITDTRDTTFGRVTPYAPDTLEVAAEATARCVEVGILGGYAVFGEASSCSVEVGISAGTSMTLDGGIHSNEDLTLNLVSGSPAVSGPTTYRGTASGNAVSGAVQYFGSAIEYPDDIAGYTPSAEDFFFPDGITNDEILDHPSSLGTMNGSTLEITEPGIYRTDEGVDLGDVRLAGDAASDGVTFVADRTIRVRNLENFRGHDDLTSNQGPPVAFYSTDATGCLPAIQIGNDGDVTWDGIAFARNGAILVDTDGVVDVDGSLIGRRVGVRGQTIDITYIDDPSIEPTYEVELVG